jgi:hypothetical protein
VTGPACAGHLNGGGGIDILSGGNGDDTLTAARPAISGQAIRATTS